MTRNQKWDDTTIDQNLNQLAADGAIPGEPEMTHELLHKTRARVAANRKTNKIRLLPVAAAVLLSALLLIPTSMAAMEQGGLQFIISNMNPAKWIEQGFKGWLASPGSPEFLSPEETAEVAPFPIRVPAWLPEGYQPISPPQGAYSYAHMGGRWQVIEDDLHFFVSQSFRPSSGEEPMLSVMHRLNPVPKKPLTLAPGTEMLTIAGHKAYLELNRPWAKADKENEQRSKRGELPEIVSYTNDLTIWVEDSPGLYTIIAISSELPAEVLIQVAESLF